jgi:lipopolysaccharide transport system ATP-binding protein
MSTAAVRINDVSKKFRLYHERNQTLKSTIMRGRRSVHEDFWALRDVDFEVKEGSTFGLIGSNGSGKSTLLKCLAKIYWPTSGSISYNGRMAALLEVGSGFHHELSGRENIYLNGSILGMSKREIDRKYDEIVDFSGVEKFIDQPVKNYSSGMYVRLGFAVAISVQPDILIVDEVLAVGDAEFQEKCFAKFRSLKQSGHTVILVSHSMGSVRSMCDEVAWLNKGTLMQVGDATSTIKAYQDSVHHD